MRFTGLLCKIDSMGRIVLPKPLREAKGLVGVHPLKLGVRDDVITITEVPDRCIFCGGMENLLTFKDTVLCESCRTEIVK